MLTFCLAHLVCNNINHVELIDFFDDFTNNFHSKKFRLETNASFCKFITIRFDLVQFPHLMGLEKLNIFGSHARENIRLIQKERITLKQIKKDDHFGEIKTRFTNYSFLEQIFYTPFVPDFVSITNMHPKRLGSTDLLFFRILNKRDMVCIGIAKDGNDYYVPTTLHVRKIPNDFQRLRRIRIIKKDWVLVRNNKNFGSSSNHSHPNN